MGSWPEGGAYELTNGHITPSSIYTVIYSYGRASSSNTLAHHPSHIPFRYKTRKNIMMPHSPARYIPRPPADVDPPRQPCQKNTISIVYLLLYARETRTVYWLKYPGVTIPFKCITSYQS
jgi:hypothetical protein